MRLPLGFTLMLSALLAAQAGSASAQGLGAGIIEVSPSFLISHASSSQSSVGFNSSSTTVALNTGVGYCFTRSFEVQGTILIDHLSQDLPGTPGGGFDVTQAGLSGGVTYNFPASGMTIPFARAELGFLVNSNDFVGGDETSLIAPSLTLGLRVMTGRTASVNLAVNYLHEGNAEGIPDLTQDQIAFAVGVSLFPNRR